MKLKISPVIGDLAGPVLMPVSIRTADGVVSYIKAGRFLARAISVFSFLD